MKFKSVKAPQTKSIALVAHDNMKQSLIDWCLAHEQKLSNHNLFATGTTGSLLEHESNLRLKKLISGPLGGDQQIGAMITGQLIDLMIFYWDPLEAQPHDPDVKALIRLAAVWNIPVACNVATADFLINSPLFDQPYQRRIPDYQRYIESRTK